MDIKLLLEDYDLLCDLLYRLTLDYNGDEDFSQQEEDRLVIGHIVDMIYDLKGAKQMFEIIYSDIVAGLTIMNNLNKECLEIIDSDYKVYGFVSYNPFLPSLADIENAYETALTAYYDGNKNAVDKAIILWRESDFYKNSLQYED